MSINLNFQAPPMPEFKNYSLIKMKEKLYGVDGKKNEEKDSTEQQSEKMKKSEEDIRHRQRYQRWVRLLLAAIFIGLAIPVITWIMERISKLIKAAKGIESACLA